MMLVCGSDWARSDWARSDWARSMALRLGWLRLRRLRGGRRRAVGVTPEALSIGRRLFGRAVSHISQRSCRD